MCVRKVLISQEILSFGIISDYAKKLAKLMLELDYPRRAVSFSSSFSFGSTFGTYSASFSMLLSLNKLDLIIINPFYSL